MPFVFGTSRRAIGSNIGAEIRAGKRPKVAVAIALNVARRGARRKRLGNAEGPGWRVTFDSVTVIGQPFYEVKWHKAGVSRAHCRHEGRSLAKAQDAFALFVREAQKESGQ